MQKKGMLNSQNSLIKKLSENFHLKMYIFGAVVKFV